LKRVFSKLSLWFIISGLIIALGQYFTSFYNSTILVIGTAIYMIGFVLSVVAFVKGEKGLVKYVGPVSFVLIPALLFVGGLLFALNFND